MPKFYLTNAIAYVNGAPHIGHALEAVQGDALTRYHRMIGDDTRFLVGTDEFGTKNLQMAEDQGVTPQDLADKNSEGFRKLHKELGTAEDDFIRTTSDLHQRGAQKLWKMIDEAGKFYDKEYEGNYCNGCESFKLEKDLVDGLCPNHKKAPVLLKETNIFFKLSDYNDILKEKIESGEFEIKPESRKNEILGLLKEGLHDVSFSRPKSSLPWGVDVPGREDQVMYVWCDALSNYLTALGFADDDFEEGSESLMNRYWPAEVHLVGKDITRFHCCFWPAMLLAAGLPLPKAVYAHGFVTSEGQKMSKSLGNVVEPFELLEEGGKDPVRYYLLREIPTGGDGDFSRERFEALYKDELQNTIGNLVQRVVSMVSKYFEGEIPKGNGEALEMVESSWKSYHSHFLGFDIKKGIEDMLGVARWANGYVDENKPWALAKTDTERLAQVLGNLIEAIEAIGKMLIPVLPDTAERILARVQGEKIVVGEPLFPRREVKD
jgi:methionyl-tRNA synthetase